MSSFQALGVSEAMLETISKLGFETPTPIQEQTIPLLLTGAQDIVALAQTGTGKTAAFGIPLIERIDPGQTFTSALVLAPTRELCLQITSDLNKFSEGKRGLSIVPVYGGASISDQIKKIRRGAHIIVATPGRLMDLMERKVVKLESISMVVLDEADEMLNMGFKEDIDHILSQVPEQRNIWLFSATMPKAVRLIAQAYMQSPAEINVGGTSRGNENIEHQYVVIEDRFRYEALKRMVDYNLDIFGVIFCRTKIDTQQIAEKLIRDGYNADALHGDLTQQQRDRVMGNFRNKTLQLLVATDVAARGIDVSNITHVIHYHLPDEMEFYTHRSGRTARAGKKGISIAITTRRDGTKIRQIEKALGSKVKKIGIPTGPEVCKQRLVNLVHRLREVKVVEDEINDLLPVIYDDLLPLSKEEIIQKFTSLEFNHLLDYYRGAPDLNESNRDDSSKGDFERFVTGDRLFINLGKMDGLDKGRILSLICDRTGIKGRDIGKIELKGAYSFFEVGKDKTQTVREHLHGFEYRGRIVRIEVTEKQEGRSYERKSSEGRSFEGRSNGSRPGGRDKNFKGKSSGRSDRSERSERKDSSSRKKGDDWFDSKMKGW